MSEETQKIAIEGITKLYEANLLSWAEKDLKGFINSYMEQTSENIKLRLIINKTMDYVEESIKNPMYPENICGCEDGTVENLDKLLILLKGEENE